jgi:hypothetical protein
LPLRAYTKITNLLFRDLQDLLIKLELSKWGMIKSAAELYGMGGSFQGLSNIIGEIKNYHNRMMKYSNTHPTMNIRILEGDEKEKYKHQIKEFAPIHEKIQEEIAHNRDLIKNR